jgi:hypothetical protein
MVDRNSAPKWARSWRFSLMQASFHLVRTANNNIGDNHLVAGLGSFTQTGV